MQYKLLLANQLQACSRALTDSQPIRYRNALHLERETALKEAELIADLDPRPSALSFPSTKTNFAPVVTNLLGSPADKATNRYWLEVTAAWATVFANQEIEMNPHRVLAPSRQMVGFRRAYAAALTTIALRALGKVDHGFEPSAAVSSSTGEGLMTFLNKDLRSDAFDALIESGPDAFGAQCAIEGGAMNNPLLNSTLLQNAIAFSVSSSKTKPMVPQNDPSPSHGVLL